MEIILAIAVAIAGAVVGSIAEKLLSQRQLRHQATTALFKQFHSPEMLEARRIAWVFLTGPQMKPGLAIQDIHDGKDLEIASVYHALLRVVYFWLLVYINYKHNTIHKRLARDMLGYHFLQWQEVIAPLAESSQRYEKPPPDWTPLFVEKQLLRLFKK